MAFLMLITRRICSSPPIQAVFNSSKLSFRNRVLVSNPISKRIFSARLCVEANNDFTRSYQVVVAATREMGIGRDGKLPWRLPSDLRFFKELTLATASSDSTKRNAVVMGRKTWESIPPGYRPLHGRLNVVLSRTGRFEADENVLTCASVSSALRLLAEDPYKSSIEKVFVIGGGQILRDMLNTRGCDAIHITEIETSVECDTFIPTIDLSLFRLWYSSPPLIENDVRYSFATYVRVRNSVGSHSDKFEVENFTFLPERVLERHDEYQYLRLVPDLISSDNEKSGTLLKSEHQMRFNLRRLFPLLTTKRISWPEVIDEVLRFIRASSNPKLSDVIDKIKQASDNKLAILPSWDPSDPEPKGRSCSETMAQVAKGELFCQLHQKSADIILGCPFNIASYALLTCIIAHVCGLVPGDFTYMIKDAHLNPLYIGQMREQLKRHPKPSPTMKINQHKKNIYSFEASDFQLSGYDPHRNIDMAKKM